MNGTCNEHELGEIGFPRGDSPDEFLANMKSHLEDCAAKLASPKPIPFSPADLRMFAAIQDAVVIEKEVRKGDLGHPAVVSNAELLEKQVWDRWRAGEGLAPSGPQFAQVMDLFAEIAERQLSLLERNSEKAIHPAPVEVVDCQAEQSTISPLADQPPSIAVSATSPLFSQIAEEYLSLRKGGGADEAVISTARLRLDAFIELVGDRPLDQYRPLDLQNYVNELQYVPVELTRQGPNHEALQKMGLQKAIAKNKEEHCYEPLALKTMQDGYVQVVKAAINNAVGLHRLSNPFSDFRIRWPSNAKPSVEREVLDFELIDKIFKLGVASGYLDDAMLPPLALMSTRRIGILPFLKGTDFDDKHGVDIVRVNGIIFDKAKACYIRIPFKTGQSLRFFVLHDFFRRIGFIEWAKSQGDAFIFRRLQQTEDPADSASKRINRLLKRAGAIGKNIEVVHSLRHGAKDLLIDEDIDDKTTRLQMGHGARDDHTDYGRREALRRTQCRELARFELPKEIDWSIFEGLDFEAMASKPRTVGRPRRA